MLDLRIFKDRLFAAATASAFINGLARFALMFLFVFYFQGAQGNSPIAAGIKLIPLALGMLIASPIAGVYADRHGSRALAAVGMLVSAVGLAAMTTLGVDTPYWQSGLWLLVVGVGSGMFNSPNTAAMMGAVPAHRRGIAAGARTLVQNTGAVLSIAFVLAIVTSAVPKATLFAVFSGLAKRPLGAEARAVHREHACRTVGAGGNLAVGRGRLSDAPATRARERAVAGRPGARSTLRPPDEAFAGGARSLDCGRRTTHGDDNAPPPSGTRRAANARMSNPHPDQQPSPARPESLRIGDVARVVGTTPRTIRYYEEIGLLPEAPARPSGQHRIYTEAEVERLREVMRLKDLLGVSLDELKTLLTAEEARAEVRAQLRREDVHPERRHELLNEALGHIDRQLALVRRRAAELGKLEQELCETRKRVRRKIRGLDAASQGSFPPAEQAVSR